MIDCLPWFLVAFMIYGLIYHPNTVRNALTAGPIAPVVGVHLLYRVHEKLITRLAYIGSLLYWFVYLSGATLHDQHTFNALLVELFRFPSSDYGERDMLGTHWTINIAQELSMTVINVLLEPLAETHFWKLVIFNCFMVLLVFGHFLVRLWVQKAISKLTRWNRNAWRWRELIIESLIQSLFQRLDSRVSRVLLRCWWSLWYWLHDFLDGTRTLNIATQMLITRLLIRTEASAMVVGIVTRHLFLWRL